MDESIDMDSGSEDTEIKDTEMKEETPNELPKPIPTSTTTTTTTTTTTPTSTTTTTTSTPKRKRLTEEEKQKREDEKKKREEDRIKREEDKKKKDEEKKKLTEEREIEKKKRDEEKKKLLEEKEINRKKREEEAEKKRIEKKKKEEEIEKKKEEIERKKGEAERLKEEEQKKQKKLTSFFSPIEAPIKPQKSNSFIQPIELPSNTQLYQYQLPTYSNSYEVFKESISSSNDTIKLETNQKKRDYFSKLNRGTQHGELGQRNHRFKLKIDSLPGAIMHHDLVSRLSALKLLKFHDSFRPSYYGTFSKTSKQITAKNPFKKDLTIDYDYDSSDEWEEEKDDDQAEKITSADEKEEDQDADEEENEEDRAWIDDIGLNDDDDTQVDNSTNISVNERVFSRKNKKKRFEEKKPIILEPYFNQYPTIINLNVHNKNNNNNNYNNNNNNNNNNNTENNNENSNNSLEFLKIFTIQPLGPLPIKLEKPIDPFLASKEDRSFPIKALPTFLFIMKTYKLSFKKLVVIFKANFPNINQRQIKDMFDEHCTYSHRVWSLKPQSELIFARSTIDPLYPVPNIPKPSPTKKEKEKEKQMFNIGSTDPKLSGSPNRSKSKKKPNSAPVQTNSLLNYFTKIEPPQPSSQPPTQTPPLQSPSLPLEQPSPQSQSQSQSPSPNSSQQQSPKQETSTPLKKSRKRTKTDVEFGETFVHIEPIKFPKH